MASCRRGGRVQLNKDNKKEEEIKSSKLTAFGVS
jgi:hypothetical protein